MRNIITAMVIVFSLLMFGCASMKHDQASTRTSDPMPVDAKADNAVVLKQLTAGLLIVLDINGDMPSLTEAHVVMVPESVTLKQEGEFISITGLSSGKAVSSIQVPDQRLNVQENVGLVYLDKRTISATLPLPALIDSIEIRLPGKASPRRFKVVEQIDSYCRKNPRSDLCRSAKKEAVNP